VGQITRFLALPDEKSEVASGFVETSEAGDLNRQTTRRDMRYARTFLVAALVSAGLATSSWADEKTLYSRLGGKKAITAVVDEFVGRVAGDNRINSFFKATASDPKRLAKFKKNLVDQICEASGGPCKYKGKDTKTAHAGMGVGEGDFNALVEDLVGALDKFNVGATEKDQLLGALGPMKKDIVEK
jgi:hemoglobin